MGIVAAKSFTGLSCGCSLRTGRTPDDTNEQSDYRTGKSVTIDDFPPALTVSANGSALSSRELVATSPRIKARLYRPGMGLPGGQGLTNLQA
jgi:hypothetical protein